MQEAFSPEEVAKRSLTVKRELDAAARSKAAKSMLDKAAAAKKARLQEDFAPISDAITLVANQQYADATQVVNDLLSQRVLGSLEERKTVIAKSLFAPSADALSEEHESVEDFVKRGGKVKEVAPHAAHGAQKKQKIKVPFRMGKSAR